MSSSHRVETQREISEINHALQCFVNFCQQIKASHEDSNRQRKSCQHET